MDFSTALRYNKLRRIIVMYEMTMQFCGDARYCTDAEIIFDVICEQPLSLRKDDSREKGVSLKLILPAVLR